MPLKEKKGCAVMEFVDDYTRVHKSSPLAKRDNDKFTRVLRVKDALRLDVMKL